MTCATVILQCGTELLGLLEFKVCVLTRCYKCISCLENCQQHLLSILE